MADERRSFNARLIDEVERHPALWNMSDATFKNQQRKDVEWCRIALLLKTTVREIKKRWKNLRDSFRRIYKAKNPTVKSGAAAEEKEPPRIDEKDIAWKYYDRLMFLRDTVIGRPTSGNLEHLSDEEIADDQSEEPTEAQQIFAQMYDEDDHEDTAPVWVGPDACGGTPAQADVEVLATGPSLPVPMTQARKRKQQRQFDNELAELSRVIAAKPDEAEHCGLLLAAKIRRCPERLRDDMQMALLRTANEFLEQANA